jgi:hypothetical protein
LEATAGRPVHPCHTILPDWEYCPRVPVAHQPCLTSAAPIISPVVHMPSVFMGPRSPWKRPRSAVTLLRMSYSYGDKEDGGLVLSDPGRDISDIGGPNSSKLHTTYFGSLQHGGRGHCHYDTGPDPLLRRGERQWTCEAYSTAPLNVSSFLSLLRSKCLWPPSIPCQRLLRPAARC